MDNCLHCDQPAPNPIYVQGDADHSRPFCCNGCLTVYEILHEKGYGDFYEIKKMSQGFRERAPVRPRENSYGYLDSDEFHREYSWIDPNKRRVMEFYLEGIHCLACLWLIEKLHEFVPGVRSSKLDLDRSVVTIVLEDGGQFSAPARELELLGYRPHVLKINQDGFDLRRTEERRQLRRIGVSGAAAGNIMIYAVSLYGGATEETEKLFNFLTVVLAIPVLSYCAWPFYQSAWVSLKNRMLSIDIPISMALILGGILGVANLFLGRPENYFDSLTTLVFLLLLSRYFLQKIQQRGLMPQDLHFFYQSENVKRKNLVTGEFEDIHSRSIEPGDVLEVSAGDLVPADGVVLGGDARLNNSLLTGESAPVKVREEERVYSGAQNVGSSFLMRATQVGAQSRIGEILRSVENGWGNRSETVDLTSRVSKYFTASVCALSVILFFWVFTSEGVEAGLLRAVTLLIVTCPCALALSVPLTFNRSLSLAAGRGIIIKNDAVIEKLSRAKNVFFDKTGTLTFGKPMVENFSLRGESKVRIADVIHTLEKVSRHPVALALVDYARSFSPKELRVNDFVEVTGSGVSGRIESSSYEIKGSRITEDGKIVATFEVKDSLRPESRRVLGNFTAQGLRVGILSGDSKTVVDQLCSSLGLEASHAFGEISPEKKSDILRASSNSVMIGDGANDAMALQAASVGVAVSGAMDISLRAADVYLTSPGLEGVEKLFILSQETMKVIQRNLVVSLLYNSVSVFCVYLDVISPLVAAIIMPVSSFSVLLSSLIGTKKLRVLWKS